MADEKEKVLYEFQGNVTSLKKATTDAIGMLDKFQGNMNKLNSDGMVKASQRAQAGFQNSVNKMIKSVASVQKKLSSVGDVKVPRGTEAFRATEQAIQTLESTLNKLNSSNTITSKSLNAMKAELNNVTAGLKGVSPSFDALVAKEEKFQQRLQTIGNVANQFSSKLQGATQRVQSFFGSMGTSIGAKLNAIGSKFDPLVAKLQGFKDRAVIAGNRVAQVFQTVAAAFRRTSDGTEGASRSQSRFGKILDSIREKLNNHQKELKETSDGQEKAGSTAKAAGTAMSAAATGAKNAFSSVSNVVKGVTDSLFALAGVEVGNLLADGTKHAIDFVENMNLFEVAMGSSIEKGNAFVAQMQEVYGMDPSNIYRYAGNFYQLTDAIGMCDEASATVSLSLTKAANDLSSLFNTDIETVVNDLTSGMQGMTKSVRKYGMDIRATTLQQTAYKYGLEENVESMSEADREALRYITMLEQAQNAIKQTTTDTNGMSHATGDFARNIETPANQLRIFKEQVTQLGRSIGNFIVVPLQMALPYINGFIMALRTAVDALFAITGLSVKAGESLSSVGDGANSGLGDIAKGADKAAKKVKQLIAPFDELNVLQDKDSDDDALSGMSLDPKLAEALSGMSLDLEDISMKANKVRDSILEFLGLEITTDPITGEQIIQWDKEAFMGNVMSSLDAFKNWFADLSPFTKGAIAIGGVTVGISTIASIVPKVISAINLLSNVFAFLATPAGTVVLVVAGIIAALTLLLTFSEDFRVAFTGLFSKVGASLQEWGAILKGVFTTIGTDLTTMWGTHIQPTIDAIGSMLAPALGTLGSLWGNVSVIISDCLSLIGNQWTKVVKPALEGAMKIIKDLCAIIKDWWEKYFDPVFRYIGDGIQKLWTEKIKPVIDKVISIVGKLVELIMALWNNPLKPIVEWVGKVLGPIVVGVFKAIWDGVSWAIGLVMNILNSLLGVLEGVIDFLVGVFTGDWKRAFYGLVNILVGVGNFMISIFEGVVNGIIWLINSLIEAIWQGIQGLINIVLGAVEGIADFLGFDLDIKLNAQVPNIPSLNIPRIPEVPMATGAVVTGPTRALIGEGRYDEAVIPLENSPQMQDLVDKIADAVQGGNGATTQPMEVRVFIGDKEFDAYTYKASERGKKIVGKQPVKIGG